ncbi:magnesium transporter CorA family protein [Thermopolyspora sp. NPDC052614]|uniref:magnesium transporter CorA family protein n=1 Tax=Thermopolyspora sp. NPDC052614 TaxID=3155682 RepID=UPI0034423EC1
MSRARLYRNGVLEAEGFPVSEVSEHVRDPSATVWFDLCAPSEAELAAIGEALGLHPLSVEDVLQEQQRPKLDVYDSHLFLTVYALTLDATGTLRHCEVDVFLTANAMVTVRENDLLDIDAVTHRWDAARERAGQGVAFLLHGLLDYVVDGHLQVAEELDDRVEELEDLLFDDRPQGHHLQRRTFELRKTMLRLRRVTKPMRDLVDGLDRRELGMIGADMAPYFRDVYDHVLRVSELNESMRELLGNVRETYLTLQGNRMNAIMKKVTSWAAIIAVPTSITGFFGQNVPFFGYGLPSGLWISVLLMVVTSVSLYVVFRKWDWL